MGSENVRRRITAIKWIGISFIIAITLTIPVLLGALAFITRERMIAYDTSNNATVCRYSRRYDLGERVYLTLCKLDGYVILDIRRFINNTATITGIALNVDQWLNLKRLAPRLDAVIEVGSSD